MLSNTRAEGVCSGVVKRARAAASAAKLGTEHTFACVDAASIDQD